MIVEARVQSDKRPTVYGCIVFLEENGSSE